MTSTLVQRLRDHEISPHHGGCQDCYHRVMDEAADALEAIVGHLGAAIAQRAPSDDKVIFTHIEDAYKLARAAEPGMDPAYRRLLDANDSSQN